MEIKNNSKILKTKDCARIIDWLYRNSPIPNPYLAEEVIIEDEEVIDVDDRYNKPSGDADGYWGEETTWYQVTTAYYLVGREYYPLELKRSVKKSELIWFD